MKNDSGPYRNNITKMVCKEYNNLMNMFKQIVDLKRINVSSKFAKNVTLMHGGVGVVIHGASTIGKNVVIWQNVTVGHRHGKVPTIEDNVTIFCNSAVLGDITVGHDSIIGAGSVVIHDVPPYSLVVGNISGADKPTSLEFEWYEHTPKN